MSDNVFVDSSDEKRIKHAWIAKDFNIEEGSIFGIPHKASMVASHYKKKNGGCYEFISLITDTKHEKIEDEYVGEKFIYMGEVYMK